MNKNEARVGIVGGGILGLVLAYKLAKQGIKVTLIEKGTEWGGLASAIKIDGFYIEKYYHHLFKGDKYIQDLVKEIDLENKLKWYKTTSGILDKGRFYNFSNIYDILTFPLLNIFQRLRLGIVTFWLQKMKSYKRLTSLTAIEWCNKYFGRKITRVLWEPLLKGKFAERYTSISMAWLWARIHDRSSSRPTPLSNEYLGYFAGSFQVLIDRLVELCKQNDVEMLDSTAVSSHKYNGKKHIIHTRNNSGVENNLEFTHVVSTMPGPIFNTIFETSEEFKKTVYKVEYVGATCVLLVLKKSFMPYYWLSVTDSNSPFLAVIEHTNLLPKSLYNNKHLLYIAKYLDAENPLYYMSEQELLVLYERELQKVNQEFNLSWVEKSFVFKSPYAQHVVNTTYEVPPYKTPVKNLYYANFSQIYPHDRGTNFAVMQALELTDIISKEF